jgi:endonuclease/exonuclease/phosphatase family metal-dependent hydrolase
MDTVSDGVNQWRLRKDRVFRLFQFCHPDLVGVQEALPHQLADLHAAFPSFDWYGVGRDDGKDKGEFSAIFYRLDIFELYNNGTFWLSKTPDTPGSRGWDAALPRICSWVILHDQRTNQYISHFNTHLDHAGKIARREGARLITDRIRQIAGPMIPTILTGDFNDDPESDAYRTIVTNSSLRDAKHVTKSPHRGPQGTWSTFDARHRIGKRLDYIFISSQHFTVLRHAHIAYSENKSYPSDHLPVLADLIFKNQTRRTIF